VTQVVSSVIAWLSDPQRAIAAGIAVLALATAVLAVSTARSARATRRVAQLQAKQTDVLRRELELAEMQSEMTRTAMMPKLRLRLGVDGDAHTEASLVWAHGVGPAYDIEVWVRRFTGYRVARRDFMTPGDQEINLFAVPALEAEVARLPFPHFRNQLGGGELWVGALWHGPDGSRDGLSEKYIFPETAVDAKGTAIGPRRVSGPGPG